jgi:hypothetical protein
MKSLILNLMLLMALLMASCGSSTDNSSGGKIISIRDQIGLTDSLQNGNSSLHDSNEEVQALANKSPLEQLKVMVEAAEAKNSTAVNGFIDFDALESNGSLDYFDYLLFDEDIPSEYMNNKRRYLMKNSHKLFPTYLKSEFIQANSNQKNKINTLNRTTILTRNDGEFSISGYLDESKKLAFNISQEYPEGMGGGSLMYRFDAVPGKKISLVQIMLAGGSISF